MKRDIQQGDLILEVINAIPTTAKKMKVENNFVILKGEGVNTHELVGTDFEVYQDGETIYLKTNKEIKLKHEEHGTQTIAPNKIYKRVIEREFDYEQMESRQTRD